MKLRAYIAALHAALFAILLAASPAGSGSMTLLGVGKPAAAGGGCSQATTFLARTSGLSGTETTAYTNLICGLVTDGIITGTMAGSGSGASACGSTLDALYIFATNTTTTAHLNLCSTSFGITESGSPTFSADHGYNGTSAFLDTGFVPSTAAGNYALNTASLGVYTLTNRTAVGTGYSMGCLGSGSQNIALVPKFTDTFSYAQVNNSSVSTTPTAMASAKGLLIGSRTGAALTTQYKFDGINAGSVGTPDTTGPGATLSDRSIYILAQNSNGTAANFTTDQISAAFIGNALNSTQAGQMSSRINGFMTDNGGINVY